MTTLTYRYIDLITNQYSRHIRPEFIVINSIPIEAVLIRLFVGTLRIENLTSANAIDQLVNYSVLGTSVNHNISTRWIRECVEPESSLSKLCLHLHKTKITNKAFFENLLEEFSSFFYKTAYGQHTVAFLHLYRCLEYMSYSFPLLYASVDRDYYGTYNSLKNFFDTSKNELLFFSAYLNKLLDQALLDSPVTFQFTGLNPQIARRHYSVAKRFLKPEEIIGDAQYSSLTIEYKTLLKLMVEFRNRYFHFAVGGKRNIKGTDIIENDLFFGTFNKDIANWLIIVYFENLKYMCEK